MAASPEFDFEAIREIALHNQEYSQRETRSEKWDECEKAWSDFNEAIKNKNLETKQIGEMIDKLLKICPDQAVWYNKGFYFEWW